jgi:hypothetical protein
MKALRLPLLYLEDENPIPALPVQAGAKVALFSK